MEDGDNMIFIISYWMIGLIYAVCSYKHTIRCYYYFYTLLTFTIGDCIFLSLFKCIFWPIIMIIHFIELINFKLPIPYILYEDKLDFLQQEEARKLLKSAKKYLK